MISVFVSTNGDDLCHWRWKTSVDATDYEAVGKLMPICGAPFSAAVRRFPIPSIVLSMVDEAISGIAKSIYDCDEHMLDCIKALRQVVAVSFPGLPLDEPICFFVHRV